MMTKRLGVAEGRTRSAPRFALDGTRAVRRDKGRGRGRGLTSRTPQSGPILSRAILLATPLLGAASSRAIRSCATGSPTTVAGAIAPRAGEAPGGPAEDGLVLAGAGTSSGTFVLPKVWPGYVPLGRSRTPGHPRRLAAKRPLTYAPSELRSDHTGAPPRRYARSLFFETAHAPAPAPSPRPLPSPGLDA